MGGGGWGYPHHGKNLWLVFLNPSLTRRPTAPHQLPAKRQFASSERKSLYTLLVNVIPPHLKPSIACIAVDNVPYIATPHVGLRTYFLPDKAQLSRWETNSLWTNTAFANYFLTSKGRLKTIGKCCVSLILYQDYNWFRVLCKYRQIWLLMQRGSRKYASEILPVCWMHMIP